MKQAKKYKIKFKQIPIKEYSYGYSVQSRETLSEMLLQFCEEKGIKVVNITIHYYMNSKIIIEADEEKYTLLYKYLSAGNIMIRLKSNYKI